MRHLTLLAAFGVLCLSAASPAAANGQYTIIGPGTLHSDSKYNVAVAVHHTNEPAKLKVGLVGPDYNDEKTVELQPNEVQNVEFVVPVLKAGDYNLTAEGVEGIIFKNSTKLNFEIFSAYTKVQTDKGKYKPGDLVNFRVLFLDENLLPGKPDKDAKIWFEDEKRNRIKEFKDLEVVKGVYTGKFKISEFAPLGSWRLLVKNGNDYSTDIYFDVEKYVLPKYEVSVTATDRVSVKDGDVHVVVKANYTYGKPVDGRATVILNTNPYYVYNQEDKESGKEAPKIIKSLDMVNGKAKFDLNVKEFEMFFRDKLYATSVDVTATVEENFTGVKLNGTAYILVFPYRYSFNCITYQTCSQFEADKEAEVSIKVSLVDDTPVADTKSVVKLIFTEDISEKHYWRGFGMDAETSSTSTTPKPVIEKNTLTFESHLNETGVAVFKVNLPDLPEIENYLHFYRVEVEYLDEKRQISSSYQYRKPKKIEPTPEPEEEKEYFKLFVHYPKESYSFNLSNTIPITVNSSEPLTYFIYNVIGRGNILKHERIEVPNNEKEYNITLQPTFLMAPYVRIYVYYVDEQGELHYAENSLHIDVELQNKIEISGPEEVKPGADVALRIKTAPNSFVGLLAVDQSVLLLAGSNDISAYEFNWRLGRYDTSTPWQGGYSRYPGEQSGVVTLTNADFFYNRTKPDYGVFPLSAHRKGVLETSTVVAHDAVLMSAAAPGSFGGGSAAPPKNEIAVRKDFSETWIFANIENTQAEEFTWSKKIPDTITSWVVSGFAISPEKGLGVTKDTTKIKTFQPFFIAIRLPYSVKRGEVINVPALVFNYLDKDLDVQITLDNTDGEYEFTEVSNEVINEPKREKSVLVPALASRAVSFMIRPKVIGNLLLKFTAVSPIAGDAIHKPLKVVPEGVTEYANRAYFVNLKDKPEFKESFELALPSEVVPDSEHIEFTVIGDLLGPLLNNLDHLVRMPTGCGEQTVSALVPNYIVLRYLKGIDKLTPELEAKIKHNLESGYQHILSFRLEDGSFSSFGVRANSDKPINGSTWLTSYVVRSLIEAQQHIVVDDKIIEEGLAYLARKQAENGSYVESNDFFYSPYRNHITLTANVLLAFLQNETLAKTYQTNIDKGFKYILENLDKNKDLHVKAMATYALHKANHPAAQTQLAELEALAKTDDDRKWWTQDPERPSIHWWRWSYSSDVEITGYVLLTLLDQPSADVESVVPVIKWLVAQRNSYGGFSSTQDTVVGLQALTLFAKKASYEPAVMDIEVKAKGSKEKKETIKVNEENGLLLQSVELPHKTLAVDFEAKGKGAALVQIAYQYNVHEKEPKPSFNIKTVIKEGTPTNKLEMDVCVEYVGEKGASNMALLEISLPSGYVADVESFEHIDAVPRVRQTETKNGDSVIVVYFESLVKNELQCLPIEAIKSFAVARQKPASIVLYDYYDTTQKATDYYEVVSKLCDICDGDEECIKACP